MYSALYAIISILFARGEDGLMYAFSHPPGIIKNLQRFSFFVPMKRGTLCVPPGVLR